MIGTELDWAAAAVKAAAQVPDAVQQAAGDALGAFASHEVARVRAAASGASRVARLTARGVKAAPLTAGGRLIVGGAGRAAPGATYGDLFFGAEFGGGSRPETRQFAPYNPSGYWFFPTVEGDGPKLDQAGDAGLEAAEKVWG